MSSIRKNKKIVGQCKDNPMYIYIYIYYVCTKIGQETHRIVQGYPRIGKSLEKYQIIRKCSKIVQI